MAFHKLVFQKKIIDLAKKCIQIFSIYLQTLKFSKKTPCISNFCLLNGQRTGLVAMHKKSWSAKLNSREISFKGNGELLKSKWNQSDDVEKRGIFSFVKTKIKLWHLRSNKLISPNFCHFFSHLKNISWISLLPA